MNITEVYRKYENLDCLLSDPEWMDGEPGTCRPICYELWVAIKEAMEAKSALAQAYGETK